MTCVGEDAGVLFEAAVTVLLLSSASQACGKSSVVWMGPAVVKVCYEEPLLCEMLVTMWCKNVEIILFLIEIFCGIFWGKKNVIYT